MLGPGHYMTALNMNGFSLSLMRLDDARAAALESPVGPAAWTGVRRAGAVATVPMPGAAREAAAASAGPALEALLRAALRAAGRRWRRS